MTIQPFFPSTDRVAVLVDGDNIGAAHAAEIRAVADGTGRVDILRVYGDAARLPDWRKSPGFRFLDAGSRKNAADVLLCLDAMEILLGGGIGTFVLASDDGDFTHLALRLRERGAKVIGVGSAGASHAFGSCCSDFKIVGTKSPSNTDRSGQPSSTRDEEIRKMIGRHSKNGRGMLISSLGVEMGKAHGVKISQTPEKTWRGYLRNRPALYDLDPKGPNAVVRFKTEGFAPA